MTMTGLMTQVEFEQEFDVRSWLASSGNIKHIHSAIVNVKAPYDRRYNIKKYIYFDHKLNRYVEERA